MERDEVVSFAVRKPFASGLSEEVVKTPSQAVSSRKLVL
jgi:hypothetical protein